MSITIGARAYGSNLNPAVMAVGAREQCSCSKFRPRTRRRTTLWRSGIRPKKPRPARRCCSATACLGHAHALFIAVGANPCHAHRHRRHRRAKRQYYSWHFAVDFSGGEFGALPRDANVEAVITTSHGSTTEHVTAHYVEELKGYRALFDVRPADDSNDAIDLRMYLRIDGKPLTETWIYQWTPPSVKDRKACAQQCLGTVNLNGRAWCRATGRIQGTEEQGLEARPLARKDEKSQGTVAFFVP